MPEFFEISMFYQNTLYNEYDSEIMAYTPG